MKIISRASVFLAIFATCLILVGCWPNKEERQARAAEIQRLHCLDNQCDGDVVPKRDRLTQELLKINGQWYLGPKEYFTFDRNVVFYWPSKHPGFKGGSYSQDKQDFYEKAIEIFLTGRHRWPEPNAAEPWKRESKLEVRWRELQARGYRLERSKPNVELEVVRLFDAQGKPHNRTYFIATQQISHLSDRKPTISCETDTQPKEASCSGGDFWESDIYADYRFSAKHANDWPAINQEITRIRSLLKKVQP